MGNNIAYSAFEHAIVTIYNYSVLTLEMLDELAEEYRGMDIDPAGSKELKAKDGKYLEDICIGLVDPEWVLTKGDDDDYADPEYWEWEERYDKWRDITDERWGWR